VSGLKGLLAGPTLVRRVALANLVGNVGIVITGGAVRLTGSGLGCPTWPSCTNASFITTRAMGIHGVIENGNRFLTGVLAVLAVLAVVNAALRSPRERRVLALACGVLAGIPAQAVLGGVTVLTHLNPWVVGLHFLLSVVVILNAYAYWTAVGGGAYLDLRERAGASGTVISGWLRALTAATIAASVAVIVVGTVVTGSGPNAGSAGTHRNGLDPRAISQLHADAVFLLLGLSLALWLALHAVGATAAARRAGWLVVIELAQTAIGFVQYATRLPPLIVGAHLAGASAVWLATLAVGAAVLAQSRAATASANLPAAGSDQPRNSEGSVTSTSITTGSPRLPGMRSTLA
jgi:cytochrome c oxidase assembly protein subunit 15